MLAQGQSSSTKRGGLAVVSSGLIFLGKKKRENFKELNSLYNMFSNHNKFKLDINKLWSNTILNHHKSFKGKITMEIFK